MMADDVDQAPDWMATHDDHEDHMDSDDHMDHDEPDKNALSYILSQALDEINELGGNKRAKLAKLLGGKEVFYKLLDKPAVAKSIDSWLQASPKNKATAGRVLAIHLARVADNPQIVEKAERELREEFDDDYEKPTPRKVQDTRHAVMQKQNGARARYEKPKGGTDIADLARFEDIGRYRAARLREARKEQRK
jgi:hypothetical protein